MKIAYITAGAAGMLCGACIHDNALAAALQRLGYDATLIPLYTPLRTDEENVAQRKVFFGAVNVYLQSRFHRFGRLPGWLHRWLDRPAVLNWVSRFSSASDAKDLGRLALAMLRGEHGDTAAELETLVAWLRDELQPDLVHVQNTMLLGVARRIKEELGVPVVSSLLGEEIFLDDLIEPYRSQVRAELRQRVADADLLVASADSYAQFMAEYLQVPREKVATVRLGLNLQGFGSPAEPLPERDPEAPFTVGFLARICPEKGLQVLVDAFCQLARTVPPERLRLRIAGYLGARDRAFCDAQMARLGAAGLGQRVDLLAEVDRAGKLELLRSIDVLAVPTVYRESKGQSLLEALAAGVPIVVPRHGVFPEMVERTGGGLLVEPESAEAVAAALQMLQRDPHHRRSLGQAGRQVVHREHSDEAMAQATAGLYERLLARG